MISRARRTTALATRRAFTLTELLVTVMVMVVFTGMAIAAMIPFLRGRSLDSGARIVQSVIYQARAYAATQRRRVVVRFNHNDKSVIMYPADVDEQQVRNYLLAKPAYLPPGAKFAVARTSSPGSRNQGGPDPAIVCPPGMTGGEFRKGLVFTPRGGLDPSPQVHGGMGRVGNWEIRLVREAAEDMDGDGLIGEDPLGDVDGDGDEDDDGDGSDNEDATEVKVLEVYFASGVVKVRDE